MRDAVKNGVYATERKRQKRAENKNDGEPFIVKRVPRHHFKYITIDGIPAEQEKRENTAIDPGVADGAEACRDVTLSGHTPHKKKKKHGDKRGADPVLREHGIRCEREWGIKNKCKHFWDVAGMDAKSQV